MNAYAPHTAEMETRFDGFDLGLSSLPVLYHNALLNAQNAFNLGAITADQLGEFCKELFSF